MSDLQECTASWFGTWLCDKHSVHDGDAVCYLRVLGRDDIAIESWSAGDSSGPAVRFRIVGELLRLTASHRRLCRIEWTRSHSRLRLAVKRNESGARKKPVESTGLCFEVQSGEA